MIGPLRLPPDWTRDPDAREIVAALDRELADIARALRAGWDGQQELLRDVLAPHAAAPTPSVLVGRLARPDGPPAGGVAAGWRCWAEAGGGRFGQIEFRTTRPEVPLPVEVVRVCEEPEPGRLVPDLDVAGAVRATFRVTDPRLTFAGLTDRGPLRLFVRGGRGGVGAFQALLTDAPAAYAFDPDDPAGTIREVALRPVGLDLGGTVLPALPGGLAGDALVRLFAVAPAALCFLDVTDRDRAFDGCGRLLDLLIPVRTARGLAAVKLARFDPNCTPLVNVTAWRTDLPVGPGDPAPALALPPNTALSAVRRVSRADGERWAECPRWVGGRHGAGGPSYLVRRTAGAGGRLSVVDPQLAPDRPAWLYLDVEADLVNRELPDGLSGRTLSGEDGWACEVLTDPTPCLLPPADLPAAADDWPTDLLRRDDPDLTAAVRRELGSAAAVGWMPADPAARLDGRDDALLRMLAGVRRVSVERGSPVNGYPGQEFTVELDETAFRDGTAVLFAAVLDRFLAGRAFLTYTRLTTRTRKEEHRWPPRLGRDPLA